MWISPTRIVVDERLHWVALEEEDDKPFFVIEHYDPPVEGEFYEMTNVELTAIIVDGGETSFELKFCYRLLLKTTDGLYVIAVAKNLPMIRFPFVFLKIVF